MQRLFPFQGKKSNLKKIGFDAKRAFHNSTGLGNYSRNLISALKKFHPELEYNLYTPSYPGKFGAAFIGDEANIKIRTPEKFYHRKFSSIWRSSYLREMIDKDDVQIYHGLSNELPYKIHNKEIKTVVTIHDLIFIKYPDLYPLLDRKIYEWKFRYACETADAVIAVSEHTKQDILELYGIPEEKVHVVYQSCHDRFKSMPSRDEIFSVAEKYELPENYFIYVGAISERKNILRLLQAFKEISDNKDVDLVLVGSGRGKYYQQVQDYIVEQQLSERVKLFSNVPDEDLPALYRQSLATVYPSLYEGFGIPLIESLYLRTPVITNEEGCFAEAAGPGALYVNVENVHDLAQAMENFLKNPNLRRELAEHGYEYVQQFNEEAFAEYTFGVYREVMEV